MNCSRRGFIGGLTAATATAGGPLSLAAAVGDGRGGVPSPTAPAYQHLQDVSGLFGDGTKLYCFTNRTISQMFSAVFVTPKGRVVVIDGGMKGDAAFLGPFLKSVGGTVDYWFITHAHSDHYGALWQMMESGFAKNLTIRNLVYSFADLSWYAKWEKASVPYIAAFLKQVKGVGGTRPLPAVRRYAKGEHIRVDTIDFEVLNDYDESITGNAINNSSICMTATIAGKRILVTGDLGAEGGERLVATIGPKIRHDIIFMPHHGQSATKKSFFAAVKPSVAIWPTTDWIWDNRGFGPHGTFGLPGSGHLTTNYYKCYLQEVGVRRQYVITKDHLFV